jgi:hypothetical protein
MPGSLRQDKQPIFTVVGQLSLDDVEENKGCIVGFGTKNGPGAGGDAKSYFEQPMVVAAWFMTVSSAGG